VSTLLDGRIGVVTGATSGIGEAVTDVLLANGARVFGVARNAARLEKASDRWGSGFTPVRVDLADRAARSLGVALIRAQCDRVDFVVNNAAEVLYATPLALESERWAALLELNVLAALDIVRGTLDVMSDTAQVVNISSVTARSVPNARFVPYAVSKLALERLTDGLRMELASRGVRVSSVAPGLVDTPVYDNVSGFASTMAALRAQVPQWLAPRDVAEAVLWILSRPSNVQINDMTITPRSQAK